MVCAAVTTQHGEQGIRCRCTIQLLPKSSAIACRVMLNAYSEVFDPCAKPANFYNYMVVARAAFSWEEDRYVIAVPELCKT